MPQILDKTTIDHPELTELCLRIRPGEKSVQVMLHSPEQHNSLIFRELPLDPAAATPLAALEDAVYDNPTLLADFRRATIDYASPRFVVMPDAVDPDLRDKAFRAMFPAADDDSAPLCAPIPRANAVVVFDMPRAILNFLRRTFDQAEITHPLAVLADYFLRENPRPTIPKIYANLREGRADIIAVGTNGSLLYANSIDYREPIDAAYYLIATLRTVVPPDTRPELLLCGSLADRDAVAHILTANGFDPLTVNCPAAMFRAGREALAAPFDLITLPLNKK